MTDWEFYAYIWFSANSLMWCTCRLIPQAQIYSSNLKLSPAGRSYFPTGNSTPIPSAKRTRRNLASATAKRFRWCPSLRHVLVSLSSQDRIAQREPTNDTFSTRQLPGYGENANARPSAGFLDPRLICLQSELDSFAQDRRIRMAFQINW